MRGYKTQVSLAILVLFALHLSTLLLLHSLIRDWSLLLVIGWIHLFFLWLTQWVYVIPLVLLLHLYGKRAWVLGVLLGAALTWLGYMGFCGVLMQARGASFMGDFMQGLLIVPVLFSGQYLLQICYLFSFYLRGTRKQTGFSL